MSKTVTKTYTGPKDSGIREEYSCVEYDSMEEAVGAVGAEAVLKYVNRGIARDAQIAARARVMPAKEPKTEIGKLQRLFKANPAIREQFKELARAQGLDV